MEGRGERGRKQKDKKQRKVNSMGATDREEQRERRKEFQPYSMKCFNFFFISVTKTYSTTLEISFPC